MLLHIIRGKINTHSLNNRIIQLAFNEGRDKSSPDTGNVISVEVGKFTTKTLNFFSASIHMLKEILNVHDADEDCAETSDYANG